MIEDNANPKSCVTLPLSESDRDPIRQYAHRLSEAMIESIDVDAVIENACSSDKVLAIVSELAADYPGIANVVTHVARERASVLTDKLCQMHVRIMRDERAKNSGGLANG